MKQDADKTKVIFRKYKDGDIIALFPDLQASSHFCESYMHAGQHGGADYQSVIADTSLATWDEYEDLQEELESIGYNLLIRKNAKRL